jgi:hypothetical protein
MRVERHWHNGQSTSNAVVVTTAVIICPFISKQLRCKQVGSGSSVGLAIEHGFLPFVLPLRGTERVQQFFSPGCKLSCQISYVLASKLYSSSKVREIPHHMSRCPHHQAAFFMKRAKCERGVECGAIPSNQSCKRHILIAAAVTTC